MFHVSYIKHLLKKNPEIVRRWVNEVQEAVSSDHPMVQVRTMMILMFQMLILLWMNVSVPCYHRTLPYPENGPFGRVETGSKVQ